MRTPLLYQGEAYLQVAGAEVIGAILSAFLLGIIFDMTLYYLRVFFTRDRIILRLIVLLSFICITLQVGGIAAAQWDTFVTNVSKIESGALPVGLKIAICVVPIPVLLAQILFAERCYWVSKNITVVCIAAILIALSFSASIGCIVLQVTGDDQTTRTLTIWRNTFLWIAFATNVYLCVSFAYYIRRMKTGFNPNFDKAVDLLQRFALFSSLLPTLATLAVALAVVFSSSSDNLYTVLIQLLAPLYTISVLLTLNSRKRIAKTIQAPVGATLPQKISLPTIHPTCRYFNGIVGEETNDGVRVDCRTSNSSEILPTDSTDRPGPLAPRPGAEIPEKDEIKDRGESQDERYTAVFDLLYIPPSSPNKEYSDFPRYSV